MESEFGLWRMDGEHVGEEGCIAGPVRPGLTD